MPKADTWIGYLLSVGDFFADFTLGKSLQKEAKFYLRNEALRRRNMCVMTILGILGLLGWGAYSAGKSAWNHRSIISQFAVNVFNMPEKVYQAVIGTQKRT